MSDTTENTAAFPSDDVVVNDQASNEVELSDDSANESDDLEIQLDEDGNPILELPVDDGKEEVEFEGKKFKVDKEIKDALLRQADYTKKTQEVAEQRRQIEEMRNRTLETAEFQQQILVEVAQVVSIDNQLAQFNNLDWNRLYSEDPTQAVMLDRQMRDLMGHKQNLVNAITQKEQAQNLKKQQETAKSFQENMAVVQREIKGWSPELKQQLFKYGLETGYSEAEMNNVKSAAQVKSLHKAYLYDQLVKKQQASAKSKPQAQVAPVTRISAQKAGSTKDPDKMTVEEWTKWRSSQVTRKK